MSADPRNGRQERDSRERGSRRMGSARAWTLTVMGVVAMGAAVACEHVPSGPPSPVGAESGALRQSLRAAARSPLEQGRVTATLAVTTQDLGGHGAGDVHRRSERFTLGGVVRHGSGMVDLAGIPGLADLGGVPGHLLVFETDFGRQHGARDRQRNGITRSGHAIAVEYDGAGDGGPGAAMRGYLDGELTFSATQSWKRREGGWALEGMIITHFRGGQPVRRTTVDVEVPPLALADIGGSFSPSALGDAVRVAGGALARLLEPAPLFAQEAPGGTGDTQSWIDRAGALVTAITALGAAIIGTATAAIFAALVGLVAVLVSVGFAWMGTVNGLCIDYITAISDDPTYEDLFMDFVCFGPGGPFAYR